MESEYTGKDGNVTISVVFTGGLYSFNSREFKIAYPDGTEETMWSPPWSETELSQQLAECLLLASLKYAKKLNCDVDTLVKINTDD